MMLEICGLDIKKISWSVEKSIVSYYVWIDFSWRQVQPKGEMQNISFETPYKIESHAFEIGVVCDFPPWTVVFYPALSGVLALIKSFILDKPSW